MKLGRAILLRCGVTTVKPSKFRAQKTVIDGHTFASKKEGSRYSILKLLEKAGEIQDLKLQPEWKIEINGIPICRYIADFTYTQNGVKIVEDVKGFRTKEYRLKRKLLKAVHGITILET